MDEAVKSGILLINTYCSGFNECLIEEEVYALS
jgi:hypothetical protein